MCTSQIRLRIVARAALDAQLASLPTVTVHPDCTTLFPTVAEAVRFPFAEITSWSLLGVEQARLCSVLDMLDRRAIVI